MLKGIPLPTSCSLRHLTGNLVPDPGTVYMQRMELMQRVMKSTGSTQSWLTRTGSTQSWLTLRVTVLWLFATVVLVNSSNTCLGVFVNCVRTKQATIVPDLLEFIV